MNVTAELQQSYDQAQILKRKAAMAVKYWQDKLDAANTFIEACEKTNHLIKKQ